MLSRTHYRMGEWLEPRPRLDWLGAIHPSLHPPGGRRCQDCGSRRARSQAASVGRRGGASADSGSFRRTRLARSRECPLALLPRSTHGSVATSRCRHGSLVLPGEGDRPWRRGDPTSPDSLRLWIHAPDGGRAPACLLGGCGDERMRGQFGSRLQRAVHRIPPHLGSNRGGGRPVVEPVPTRRDAPRPPLQNPLPDHAYGEGRDVLRGSGDGRAPAPPHRCPTPPARQRLVGSDLLAESIVAMPAGSDQRATRAPTHSQLVFRLTMRRGDDSVGPRSWYWPTRYKLLVALVIVLVVIVLFILVNPGVGSSGP